MFLAKDSQFYMILAKLKKTNKETNKPTPKNKLISRKCKMLIGWAHRTRIFSITLSEMFSMS